MILKNFGIVSLVGKSFGVLKLHGVDVDWSLPRKDSAGRKPSVEIDPFMTIEDAFRRRDLTINAMGIDLITYELIDLFGGFEDLQKGILRATDEQLFLEDPLRFYRVMQFIGRFEMKPDEHLNIICKNMDLKGVSIERIETEFEKLLLKSKYPSRAIEWLHSINRLKDVLPEITALIGIQQNPKWHPEGDVYEHTKQAFDAAASIVCDTDEEQLILMYAALCHDLGKATTTKKIEGVWKSLGHEQESAILTRKMLKRITKKKELINAVYKLVKCHMIPSQLIKQAKPAAYKRLANTLAPETNMYMLANLVLADKRGRNPRRGRPLTKSVPEVELFLQKTKKAEVLYNIEPPVLLGRDLLDVVEPGPKMGRLLHKAYQIQLEEGIKDKAELKQRVFKATKQL